MLKELGDEAKTLPAYKATMVPAPVLAAAREARKWLIDPLIAAENARLRAKT